MRGKKAGATTLLQLEVGCVGRMSAGDDVRRVDLAPNMWSTLSQNVLQRV